MARNHAPRDVYETGSGDYRCGICRDPVVRYSAPRARWVHKELVSIEVTCATCGDQCVVPGDEDPEDTLCVACAEEEQNGGE